MSAPLGDPLLRVEDLHVDFVTEDGIVHAVDGITYQVHRGRTLGIVGESGSGKTVASLTTLGLTRGQRANISGRILFDGRDLLTLPEGELRAIRGNDIAMIFQDPLSSLHPFYKVGFQLIEAIRAHRDVSTAQARARAVELLGLVGIPDPARRVEEYPHEFSGGMRQRAMIAMGLANEPKLLIADEPTTALDVTVQAQILALLERLQRELGMAIVIITHDLGVVAEMADDMAVMYAGRIVETASAERLFGNPEHPYTWGLLRSIPTLGGGRNDDLLPIPGNPPSLIRPPSGCHFHPRCPYAQPDHSRIDPKLEPVPGDPGHHVACLLEPDLRRRLWAELQRRAHARGGTRGGRPAGRALVSADADPGALSAAQRQEPGGETGPPGAGSAAGEPLVQVRDLVKHFPITQGIVLQRKIGAVQAVDGVSFDVKRGRDARHRGRDRLRQEHHGQADHAPARPHLRRGALRRAGHHPPAGRAAEGGQARDADDLPGPLLLAEPAQDGRLDHRRAVRDPRPRAEQGGAQTRRAGADGDGGPEPRALQPLPARVLRRAAPAHRRGARARAEAEAADRRRARLGARRLDPGPGAQPAARPAARASG